MGGVADRAFGLGGGAVRGTLGSCGVSSGIIVGCILGMIALGSNREGCGTTGVGELFPPGMVVAPLSGVGGRAVATEKISASCCIARICSLPRVSKGEAGAGLRRASASILAASAALSDDELCGMDISCGKNSTVRAIRSALVLVT